MIRPPLTKEEVMRVLATVALCALSFACKTTTEPHVVDADPEQREALLGAVAALEGSWEGKSPDGQTGTSSFAVSSAGSVVVERMMEGTDHEMTNMYSLDGNDLVMTHYCAAGNQPRMRASGIEDGKIDFRYDGVQDLKAADEMYMGEMTLVIVDEDHIEQHWRAYRGTTLDHEMTIPMERAD
jgi:hypothetical protein